MREYMVCRNCGMFFDKNDAGTHKEYHREIADEGFTPFEEFQCCPHCGDTDIEYASVCPMCGEPHDGIYELCDKCKDKIHESFEWFWNQLFNAFEEENEISVTDALCDALDKEITKKWEM